MANIIFIQLNEYELHGLEALAGELKRSGHQVRLLLPFFERNPLEKVREFNPLLVGFSLVSSERNQALAWARAIKSRIQTKVIFGGIDPTFYPEIIKNEQVDFVLRGEADKSLIKLLQCLEEDADYSEIDNLCFKRDGKIISNPVGPLVENLDELAFPEKEIYYSRYHLFRDYPIKLFLASRGCPFSCSYCANQGLRELYPNRKSYLRFKSPDYLLAEIKAVIAKYPARTIGFNDDLFSYDENWLTQFLPRYKREIGIPFFCTGRIDLITEEKAKILKEGGCYSLWYGLESANTEDREKILNRKMTDEEIERGVEILHRNRIILQSYNMLNYPGDNLEKGLATLKFNRKLKNEFVVASLFQPFPGTRLTANLEKENFVPASHSENLPRLSYFASSPFRQPDTKKLENLHKLFIYGFRSGTVLKILRFLVKLPKNPLFDILFLISFAIDYGRVHRLKWWETVKYNAIHLRTTYLITRAREPRK